MVKYILIAVLVFFIVVFTIAWIGISAPREIAERAQRMPNPIANFIKGKPFVFETEPFMPGFTLHPIEIPDEYLEGVGGNSLISDPRYRTETVDSLYAIEQELAQLEREYDHIRARLDEAKAFGTPSPFAGSVSLEGVRASASGNVAGEFVQLRADRSNATPVDITGWSLQSAVTGAQTHIPEGVRTYRMGDIGVFERILLRPGARAILHSAPSPVGVSFQENICSGYLGQFQRFEPPLEKQCPTPRTELPQTIENLQRYGPSCIEFVETMPSCTYHVGTLPQGLSLECQTFIREELSYNSCVDRHQWRTTFSDGNWRIFLSSSSPLWRSSRDVIRLLDAEGKTVDVWTY